MFLLFNTDDGIVYGTAVDDNDYGGGAAAAYDDYNESAAISATAYDHDYDYDDMAAAIVVAAAAAYDDYADAYRRRRTWRSHSTVPSRRWQSARHTSIS